MWAAVSTSLWAHLSVGLCLDWFTGGEQESYAGPDRWKQLQSGPGSPFAKARPGHNGDSPSRWDEEEDWGSCCTPPPAHRLARTSTPRSALRTPGSSGSMRHSASMLRSVSFSCDKVRASSPTVCATVALALHACRRRCSLLSARLPPAQREVAALTCLRLQPRPFTRACAGRSGRPSPPHRPPRPTTPPLQVHEFETVEGQEWWHNDACSSQVSVRARVRVRVRVRVSVRVSARGGTA